MPSRVVSIALLLACAPSALAQPAHLSIDATDLPRHLLSGTTTIPLTGSLADDAADGEVALWYPKWVPGSHAPGGPVENVAGLVITDQDGRVVSWTRTPGEIHRFTAGVSEGTTELRVTIRYITDQPSDNSHGLDSFGSEAIGIISPNTVLVCPESVDMTQWQVATTLTLPEGWDAATALARVPGVASEAAVGGSQPDADNGSAAGGTPRVSDPNASGNRPQQTAGVGPSTTQTIAYAATSLELLIDSPIMAGRHHRSYDLHAPARDGESPVPPHRLHVFSEVESATRINDAVLANYRNLVAQAASLFGSHPFDSMDILLATSNALPRNGLEHLRTTLNVIPLDRLNDPANLTGWDCMLVPHEYVHAWCGKYRRPAGMVTRDLRTSQDTELLWVYEGLTQYLGALLEVRSGMMTREEYEWDLMHRVRWARLQQGRAWRTLADTGAAAASLRGGSATWGHLRRSQDYYDEGSLVWMEADAIIRRLSDGQRSLDDFCRAFFRHEVGDPIPKAYDRGEVVLILNETAAYDWDGFLRERIETPGERAPLGVVSELGYAIQFTSQPAGGPRNQRMDTLDARDSLGVTLGDGGQVGSVLLGSPADEAGLAPRMRIIGVGDHVWSRQRFLDALEQSPVTGEVRLLMTSGDRIIERVVAYDGGPRYMTLVREHEKADVLGEILRSR